MPDAIADCSNLPKTLWVLPNYPKMDRQPKFSLLFLLRTTTKRKYREPECQHTKISHHKNNRAACGLFLEINVELELLFFFFFFFFFNVKPKLG
jgi:hypothetical protein